MTKESHTISIWFFVGLMLTVYGVLIVGAGIYGLFNPPDVKLAYLHADLWWGGILFILGVFYLYHFGPKGKR